MIIEILKSILRSVGLRIARYPTDDMKDLEKILDEYHINLVLDVGANTGQYSTYLRRSGYAKQIISFEPLKEEFQELIKSHSKDKNWRGFNLALGDFNGESLINHSKNSYSSSLLSAKESYKGNSFLTTGINVYEKYTINVMRLDSFVKDNKIDLKVDTVAFLKIDVQGFEKKVLDGAIESLQFIKLIQLEMSIERVYEGGILFDEMFDFLKLNGFKLIYVVPGFCNPKNGKMIEFDGVFAKG